MRERPILFSGPMVRAILDGRKTQTRRALNPQPDFRGGVGTETDPDEWGWENDMGHHVPVTAARMRWCAGDRLWVREQFSGPHQFDDPEYRVPPRHWHRESPIWYWADGNPPGGDWTKPKPSIHMPRWASRITLEVTGARLERLQDISEADAIAEGISRVGGEFLRWENWSGVEGRCGTSPRAAYALLWNYINGPGAWDANPWVSVMTFKRLEIANG